MSHIYKNPHFIAPNSLTKQVGGTATGTITNVQTFNDGNVYQVVEASGVPGYEIDFDFTNVLEVHGIVSSIRYSGAGAGHEVTLRIRDYTAASDLEVITISDTNTHYAYRTILFPETATTDFVDGSNNAQVILYHNSSGNPSHDVYIDYIALLGRKSA